MALGGGEFVAYNGGAGGTGGVGGAVLSPNQFASGQREGILGDYANLDFERDLRMVSSHLMLVAPNAPTATAAAGAGTSPPAPVVSASSADTRGSLTWGTGTTPAAGAQVNVTFNSATAYPSAPVGVMLTEQNSATALLNVFVTSITTTGFTVGVGVAPAASQANTTYSVAWSVVG